jgi:glycosyltransferase involved in cell wall biosynthesis
MVERTVSIIICTRNRAESLKPTLESIGRASVPQGWNVELLVVDNGSTDHTKSVLNETVMTNVTLRYFYEKTPGLSNARNAGIRETTGEIMLFTDDDVRVPGNWIEEMSQPILSKQTDAVAGGVVFPADIARALSQPPFSSKRSWFASTEDLSPDQPSRMVGANMAFHRRILERVPSFEVELGAGALGFHEETLFSQQLLSAGFRIMSLFNTAVEHHLDLTRLSRENLLEAARKMGRSDAFIFHHWEHHQSRLVVLRYIKALMVHSWMRFAGKLIVCSPPAIQAEMNLGFWRECLVQRRRPRKYYKNGLRRG